MKELIELLKQLPSEPAKGKALERLADQSGIIRKRRFLYREGDKALRRRTIDRLNRRWGTLADVRASAEDNCVGAKVNATDSWETHTMYVRLRHRWWSWPWARGNRRRVRVYLRENIITAGVQLKVS